MGNGVRKKRTVSIKITTHSTLRRQSTPPATNTGTEVLMIVIAFGDYEIVVAAL